MDLNFSGTGGVKVSMIKYLKKIFVAFPEKTSVAATPAADHLFEVRDDEEPNPLPQEQSRAFHHSVAQLLFLSGRARPDIKTAVCVCLRTGEGAGRTAGRALNGLMPQYVSLNIS